MKRFLLALLISGCAAASAEQVDSSQDRLRPLTSEEALAELDMVGDALRANYAPLGLKQAQGFNLDQALAEARAKITAATTEGERVRPMQELVAKLKDGHLTIRYNARSDQSVDSSIPIYITPIGGNYIAAMNSADGAVKAGDKIVSIDGIGVKELEDQIRPLVEVGTPETTRHAIGSQMANRAFYLPDPLRPTGDTATVVVEHADGTNATVTFPWRKTKGGIAGVTPPAPPPPPPSADGVEVPQMLLMQNGAVSPHFLTPQVKSTYALTEIFPKNETLSTFGVAVPPTETTAPDAQRTISARAYSYTFEGKSVLLVRLPRFNTALRNENANVGWLAALLSEHTVDTDVVVLDVTHNPGGRPDYAYGIASLFARGPIPAMVGAARADRTTLAQLSMQLQQTVDPDAKKVLAGRLRDAENAYDVGNALTPFMPIIGPLSGPSAPATPVEALGTNMLAPHKQVVWMKPVLVLQDELTGSAGEIIPSLLQGGRIAKTFGARTAGMGGITATASLLPHSNAQFTVTRAVVGPYNPSGPVTVLENNGVTPSIPYSHTVEDYRASYVGYVSAFSKAAIGLIPPTPPQQ